MKAVADTGPQVKELPMLARFLGRVASTGHAVLRAVRDCLSTATKPAASEMILGTLADLTRSMPELVAENAFLRQQIVVLKRGIKRPRRTPTARAVLALLASRVRRWRQALLIVQPDTLLRWHRHLFRGYWRRKSRGAPTVRRAKVSEETIVPIREMTTANVLWGAERIRGELAKLDIRVAK